MKNKIITIGIAIVLILTGILVTPVISAENMEILIDDPKNPLTNTDLKQEYYDMVNKIANSQFPKDELETLYSECWFEDEEGEIVTVYDQIVDVFGTELAYNINILFGGAPQTGETKKSAMSNICGILENIEGDNQNIVDNCINAFEFIKNNNDISFDDFPEETRDWAEEQYNLIIEDVAEKQYLQPLINKIINSEYLALQEIDMDIIYMCILYLIALAGLMVLPLGDVVIGIAEGAIIGAGFAILMSEASITKALADVIELYLGFLIPGVNWEAAATFLLGLVAFIIYFTLFISFRFVRLAGGLAAAVGGCVAIYMYMTLFVNITEWKTKVKSTTAPATMPLMKVIMLKLFQKFAPRFQLFEWYY